MIEELTPQVVMTTLLLTLLVVPAGTFALSTLLLYRYRRAVLQAMQSTGGYRPDDNDPPITGAGSADSRGTDFGELRRRLRHGPGRLALRYLVAGLAFAMVLSLAAQVVFPSRTGLPGFLLGSWYYLWPAVLAALLIMPTDWRRRLGYPALYLLAGALLGWLAASIHNVPEFRFGAVVIPSRSSVTPESITRLWLVVNAPPTALILLCLNPWVRAVAPLVLALVTILVTGGLAVYLAVFSPRGVDLFVAASVSLDLHVYWLLGATALFSLGLSGAAGWGLARIINRGYRRRRSSDQSLLLAALWLVFAANYSMWLAWGGVGWVAAGPLACLAFYLAWRVSAPLGLAVPKHPIGLTFLRVFSTTRHSLALFENVARQWRHAGTVDLIAGPDLARRTVQPHQFLDFLAGNLGRHFVTGPASLRTALRDRDRGADPDGRFRINSLFCDADAWQAVLPHLSEGHAVVLMDLRGYRSDNAGCTHELRYLVREVPFRRCVLVENDDTDRELLGQVLASTAASLPPDAVNHGRPLQQIHRMALGRPGRDLPRLADLLATAAGNPGP